jgi:ribose 5-phosphate isomerase B
MADEDSTSTRERVRALVREVLERAVPAEGPRDVSVSANLPTFTPRQTEAFAAPAQTGHAPDELPVARDESGKTVITEDDVRGLEDGARLRIAEGARLTPLAADIVREKRIELVRRPMRRQSGAAKRIAVGADHGGFAMKEELKKFLAELGHLVRDYGTDSEAAVDYPDYAHAVARAVADQKADLGIIIDGAGVGSAITANKVPGVRAAACYSVAIARNAREHNDANVLTLGSKMVTLDEMRAIVRAWLSAEINEERHRRRVAKISAIERQYRG